jgi:hypothetical protein
MCRLLSLVPRRAWRRWLGPVVAAVLAAGTLVLAPGAAAAKQCPEGTPKYTDACGPIFVVPTWGDAGGWTEPSKFSTIQLADFNGDGRDELIGRNDQGLEIYWFDTGLGQWRPQVDAKGHPQVLTDFRSPLPNETPATDWTKEEYYTTIQTAHINGNPNAQVLARFADGMRVYYFSPGPGGSINGGSWSLISQGGPFSDAGGWNDPSRYSTIRTGDIDVSDPGRTELIGRAQSGLVGYKWNGSGWSPLGVKAGGGDTTFSDSNCDYSPACFATIRRARLGQGPGQTLVGRTAAGAQLERYDSSGGGAWKVQPGSAQLAPRFQDAVFADLPGSVDCPVYLASFCIGSSPTYYETFGAADLDGDKVDEAFVRFYDGLRVKKLNAATGAWTALPTLTDLKGFGSSINEEFENGLWASIRTANIDGRGGDEVLALDLAGLQVWSYDPASTSWRRWAPSTPLTLTGEWVTNFEDFSTIRTGDVDGDGHDDVVARGPFGIRTWFYNRRGTGGWERYLPEGYPAFPNAGQTAAFNTLNNSYPSGDIRGVWTGVTVPDATTLQTLQTNLAGHLLGNCDPNSQTKLEPPTYGSCTPPAGNNPFTAADWTAVVNELLSEAYFAEQVVGHFGDLRTIAQGLFDSESGSLPAIANDLQGAAGNSASFDVQGLFAGSVGIAASIAGLAAEGGPEVSAALWVASEVMSMLPSASATANSTFQTTYGGLLEKLATARDEMLNDALPAGEQQVLLDQALLELVGQLRSSGTWTLDVDGMQSAGRRAFALQTYQALLPSMYQRYVITNCTEHDDPYHSTKTTCSLPPKGPYVIRGRDGLSATWLAPPAPVCLPYGNPSTGETTYNCDYDQDPGTMPDSVAQTVWGAWPADGTCNYQPPNKGTVWTYGCPLGVVPGDGIGADSRGWTFTTRSGDPNASVGSVRAAGGVVRASAARGASSARAARAGSGTRASREVLGPLRFSGRLRLTRAARLRRLRVVVDRTLFEHGRREELARSGLGRRLRPFALRRVRDGVFRSRRRGEPRVRLQLRRLDARGRVRLALRLTRVRTRDIRTLCAVLPAGVSRDGRRLELETRLRLRDGSVTERITLRQRWRCVRDGRGEFTGIRPIKPKPPAARPGIGIGLGRPRMLASGRRATVLVTVTNRRRRRSSRVISSLWDLRITGSAGGPSRTIGLKELRARRSRSVRLTLRVPRRAGERACLRVTAGAASARGATARRCTRR